MVEKTGINCETYSICTITGEDGNLEGGRARQAVFSRRQAVTRNRSILFQPTGRPYLKWCGILPAEAQYDQHFFRYGSFQAGIRMGLFIYLRVISISCNGDSARVFFQLTVTIHET